MSILRKIGKFIISIDPETGMFDELEGNVECHRLSDEDGSLESFQIVQRVRNHCGCFTPAGGRCAECGRISCIGCHAHCGGTRNPVPQGCQKPLCRECSHYLIFMNGQTIPFCKSCYGKIVRKERWQIAGRILLLPFIDNKGNRNG